MKTLLMYMPVVHAGYLALIEKLTPDRILIISDEVANKFDKRRKDIRALRSDQIIFLVKNLFPGLVVESFYENSSFQENEEIHMPVEDISENILANYLKGKVIVWESVFLRYESKKSMAPEEIKADRVVSRNDPAVSCIITLLGNDAAKSPDWWRQVSAAVVKEGEVLSICHNRHAPSDVITYALGDPRSNAQKGLYTNVGKAAHAEPLACFLAGVEGCKDASLFVTTFPCPQCANFLMFTGLKSLYFIEGYSMVNGVEDLRSTGIEVVKVE